MLLKVLFINIFMVGLLVEAAPSFKQTFLNFRNRRDAAEEIQERFSLDDIYGFESSGFSRGVPNRKVSEPKFGGYSGGRHSPGGGGYAAGQTSEKLSSSSLGSQLSAVGGSDFKNAEDASRVSSSKVTSSGTNKHSKIKSATTFGGGSSNFNNEGFGASQSENLDFGTSEDFVAGGHGLGHGGIAGGSSLNLGIGKTSNVGGSKTQGNSGFFGGKTNTEIEQSESSHNTQAETYDAQKYSNYNAGSQFGGLNKSFGSQRLDADKRDSFVFGS